MPSPGIGAARLARGAGLSVVSVSLSAAAHLLGGGQVPPVGLLAGLTALLLPVGVLVAGRRLGTVVSVAVLAVEQVALHAAYGVLMACAMAMPGEPAAGHVDHAGRAGHAAAVLAAGCSPAAHGAAHPLLGGESMLAFHALATLGTALLVAGAERLLWWAHDELAARLAPPAAPATPAVAVGLVRPHHRRPLTALHLRAPALRRGPPVRIVAALPS